MEIQFFTNWHQIVHTSFGIPKDYQNLEQKPRIKAIKQKNRRIYSETPEAYRTKK